MGVEQPHRLAEVAFGEFQRREFGPHAIGYLLRVREVQVQSRAEVRDRSMALTAARRVRKQGIREQAQGDRLGAALAEIAMRRYEGREGVAPV